MLKIDVEAFESQVSQGAERLLQERGAKNLLFEDFDKNPSSSVVFLQSFGSLSAAWVKA
jgi:hypothetical protein